MDVKKVNVKEMNIGVLAYLGDAVYELEIRNYLVKKTGYKAQELDRKATEYVSAVSQSKIIDDLTQREILTPNELELINRARNYKTHSKPRYVDIKTYKKATALEVLFASLYLENNKLRIDQLMKEIMGD